MKMIKFCSYLHLLLVDGTSARNPNHADQHGNPSPPQIESVTTIYQASAPHAWIENLAIRPNGNILFTRLDVPETWQYNLPAYSASLVYRFPSQTGSTGIAEYAPDKFGVAAGNFSTTNISASHDWNIWSLSFDSDIPRVEILVNIEEARLLNGATALRNGVFLTADSILGVIFSVNTTAKTYSIASRDATLDGNGGIGVNGIKVHGEWLYYTNDRLRAVYRMPISVKDGSQTGPAQLFASGLAAVDDLILDDGGNVFVCQNSLNTLTYIPAAGNSSRLFVGGLNSTVIAGDTAVAFCRDGRGSQVLYVTTSGAQTGPVNGTFTEPGKIVQIDLQEVKRW